MSIMSTELLIRWCAPTMARLKTGSIFSCRFDSRDHMAGDLRELNKKLGQKGLRILPLKYQDGRALLYLYRPGLLQRDLKAPAARRLLSECGYPCSDACACLARLISRLQAGNGFPHEIGLFLGYPPADVDGFMHRRDSYKLCGLWKVYDNVDQAVKQFEQYRRCTQILLRRYAQGCPLEELTIAG